jgi:hypothetical protein
MLDGMNCIHLAWYVNKWLSLVNMLMNLWVP